MPVVADIYTLIVGGTLCGQPLENVLHFYPTTGPPADAIAGGIDLNTQWAAAVQAAWLAVHPDNYTYLGVKSRRCNTGGGPTLGLLAAAGTMGGRGSSASDSAIGPVIIAPFLAIGRWRTAKIFINGVGDDDLDNNTFSAALLAALDALITILHAPLAGGALGWQYCDYDAPDTANPLLNLGVSVKPGVQNRRLRPVF